MEALFFLIKQVNGSTFLKVKFNKRKWDIYKWKYLTYLAIITIVHLFFILSRMDFDVEVPISGCFKALLFIFDRGPSEPVFCFKCAKANQITPITRGTSVVVLVAVPLETRHAHASRKKLFFFWEKSCS